MKNLFDSFNTVNALVIGDVIIDSYLWGKVERISPEAPVPVLSVLKKEDRLGGAANVALNLQALGATPVICSVIGKDEEGGKFLKLLKKQQISGEGILSSESRKTTVKTRAIAHHQQVLRIDEETDEPLGEEDTVRLQKTILNLLDKHQIDVIIFEDYDKGVITPELIGFTVKEAKKRHIPVTVDPKKKNFLHYREVTLFKPNLRELKEGLKLDFDANNISELHEAISRIKNELNAEMVMVTLSENGIYIKDNKGEYHIQAHVRNIADVSGAGDTVISVASLGLARKLTPLLLASLANLAGGLVCEEVGVVPVNKEQLLEEARTIFDQL